MAALLASLVAGVTEQASAYQKLGEFMGYRKPWLWDVMRGTGNLSCMFTHPLDEFSGSPQVNLFFLS